jgi:hypothetical protein
MLLIPSLATGNEREVLQIQHLKSGGYEIETEMLVKTAKSHYRVLEVPISFEQRTYGRSGIDLYVTGFGF